MPAIRARISYTYTHLRYVDNLLSGNQVPGVPPHRLYAAVTFSQGGFFSEASARIENGYFADDANAARKDGYAVLDMAAGYEGLTLGPVALEPFVQVTNLTDLAYSGSVQVNAFGGRYYEPSPGRSVRAGLSVLF
jgi:iron complex outermembrane receptor protein